MIEKKRLLETVFTGVLALICSGILLTSDLALAQKDAVNLNIRTSVAQDSYDALKERPIMISVIKGGELVKQTEAQVNSNPRFTLSAGIYDIRLEGDGMQTLVQLG